MYNLVIASFVKTDMEKTPAQLNWKRIREGMMSVNVIVSTTLLSLVDNRRSLVPC